MRLLNYPLTGANRAHALDVGGRALGADFADIIDHFSGAWGAGAVFQCQGTKMFWGSRGRSDVLRCIWLYSLSLH